MKQYFFDIVGPGKSEYDYSGKTFSTLEKAYELAELMAFDLAAASDEWSGWRISVSSADGHRFFSIPVEQSCLGAW
jgi:hypothetical protein